MADSISVLYNQDGKDSEGKKDRAGKKTGKMGFAEFMKTMHGFKRKKEDG